MSTVWMLAIIFVVSLILGSFNSWVIRIGFPLFGAILAMLMVRYLQGWALKPTLVLGAAWYVGVMAFCIAIYLRHKERIDRELAARGRPPRRNAERSQHRQPPQPKVQPSRPSAQAAPVRRRGVVEERQKHTTKHPKTPRGRY